MAQQVLSDEFFSLNAVDYSDQMVSGTLNYEAEEVEDTTMGDTTRSRTGGLKNWSWEAEFIQDEASGQTGANFFALVGGTYTVIMRPDNSDGVGADNPNYTGTTLITSYTPLQGGVGELSRCRISGVSAGALSRATS